MRRDDMRRNFGAFRFSPRPRNQPRPCASSLDQRRSITSRTAPAGVETRERDRRVRHRVPEQRPVQRGRHADLTRLLPAPFPIAPGVTLPAGGYDVHDGARRAFNLGSSGAGCPATCSSSTDASTAATGRSFSVSRGRVERDARSSRSSRAYSINRVDLVEGRFTTHLAGSRVTYTITPLMFVSALVQYNSGSRGHRGQRAAAVGVPARQRAVRRLQRGAGHACPQASPTWPRARSS